MSRYVVVAAAQKYGDGFTLTPGAPREFVRVQADEPRCYWVQTDSPAAQVAYTATIGIGNTTMERALTLPTVVWAQSLIVRGAGLAAASAVKVWAVPVSTPADLQAQQPVWVEGPASTAGFARVATSVVPVTLLAANAARRCYVIVNGSAVSTLVVKIGAAPSLAPGAESYTYRLPPGEGVEPHCWYRGIVTGVWSAADPAGYAAITET